MCIRDSANDEDSQNTQDTINAILHLQVISKQLQERLLVEHESNMLALLENNKFDDAINLVHAIPPGSCRQKLWKRLSQHLSPIGDDNNAEIQRPSRLHKK